MVDALAEPYGAVAVILDEDKLNEFAAVIPADVPPSASRGAGPDGAPTPARCLVWRAFRKP